MIRNTFETVSRFVAAYRRRLIALRIIRVSGIVLAVFFFLLASLQLIFAFFPWTVLPLVVDAAFLGAGFFILVHAIAAATVRAPDTLSVARSIERRSGLKTRFLSLSLELTKDERTRGNPFTGKACGLAAAEIEHYPRSPGLPRYAAVTGAAAMVLGLWCLLNQQLSPRLLDYWALPFSSGSAGGAVVSPGSIAVPLYASVTLRLEPAAGRFPSSRCLLFSPEGERLSSILLRPDSAGVFTHRLDSVRSSFLYRFAVGGALTQTDTVTVVPLPGLLRLSISVRPPAYTRQAERALPEGQGNFEAYAGSTARMTIESDRLVRALLVRGRPPAAGHGDTVPLSMQGQTASCELKVDAPFDYRFMLADTLGQKNDSLPVFHIECVPDEPPLVQIIKPGFSKDLQPEQVETLAVEGADDLGVRSLFLRWKKPGRDTGGRRDLSAPAAPPVVRTAFIWDLTELYLFPGDTVFYWAEITDTKPFGRPQQGFSDTFTFRIPTFEEIHRQIVEKASSAEKTIGAVRGRQADLENRLENIMKTLNSKRELSWEQKEILGDVRKEFKAQTDSLRGALESLRENVEKMKQEGPAGEELARKFDRVREAVDSLVKEFGDSLLFAMKDVERPVSMNDLRQALEKLNSMLPRLDEQLDNVLKFLEMLKEDRTLAELAMRAERLSKEQAALSRNEQRDRGAAARQKDLNDRIQKLSRDAGAAAADSLGSKARVDSLQNALQAELGQLSGMPSRESMNQMSGALLSLSQDLMQKMNFKEALRMAQERERLLSLARDALSLTEWQEEIRRDAVASRDEAEAARSQQALRDALARTSDAGDSLSMLSPQDMAAVGKGFKGAADASKEVIDALGSGEGRTAMAASAASLRSLAGALLAALANIDNRPQSSCSGGSCMMPGLRKLSGRQAAINSMTADLLGQLLRGNRPGGNAMGGEASEARRAAQKAQAAIADELKKLADKYGKEAGEGLRGRVGELEEEAKRLAAMLERPAPEIAEHQDRFLARMLETTLSMHKEGEGKDEWKSRSAETVFSEGTEAQPGSFFKDADLFHRVRQKAYRGNYPASYRAALRAYFDALSGKYLK
jgi:hypothetical protein